LLNFFSLAVFIICNNINAQVLDAVPQTEEYAIVKDVLFYKTGTFVSYKYFDNSLNPSLQIGNKI